MSTDTTSSAPAFDYVRALKAGYDLWRNNVSAGSARTIAADSSRNWTDQINHTQADQAGLSDFISSLAKSFNDSKSVGRPSNGVSFAPIQNVGDTVTPFKKIAEDDRANMLASYALAQDAAGRRVNINGYNTDNVRQVADRKYSSAVGGIDRAATLAASQGFAKALSGGMADSTAAATQANTLSRDFADLYAKLRQEADTSALAENQATYKSYLEGQNAQVDQNSRVAQALNQTYATAANKASNADSLYASASTASAARDLDAATKTAYRDLDLLKLQDASSISSGDQDSRLLSSLAGIYGNTQNTLIDALHKRYSTDASNAVEATKGQGRAEANTIDSIMSNPVISALVKKIGKPAEEAISKLVDAGITAVGDIFDKLVGDNPEEEYYFDDWASPSDGGDVSTTPVDSNDQSSSEDPLYFDDWASPSDTEDAYLPPVDEEDPWYQFLVTNYAT